VVRRVSPVTPLGRRLLCVYQHAPTPGAPGIYRHRQYFAELVRRGWTVDLVSTPRNYMSGEMPDRYRRRVRLDEVIDGIEHHWVWTPGGIHRSRLRRATNYAAFAVAAALRALTLPRPDVVVISSPPLTVAPLGPLLARRFRCPWILEVRDIWPESAVSVGWLRRESLAYRLLERLARSTTASADLVLVPTPGLEPLVREHGARSVTTLTGAVAPRPADETGRAAARARLGVSDSECLFLYLGAIGVANGLDTLVEAVKLLPAQVGARIVVAGDGSARQALADALAAYRLDRMTLLPPVPRDEVDDLLAAADVGLHLLRPDPVFESALPSKVLDYLGAHLPFVTTVGGLPKRVALASGGGAVLSAAELAQVIEDWSALGPEERRRRGEQAFAYGQHEFGLEAGVARLEALLTELLRGRSTHQDDSDAAARTGRSGHSG
jgi:putative colanic acid biosynthesis glycosyltransferase WcaI